MSPETRDEHEIVFAPYRVDLRAERVWRGSREVILRPKTWAMLHYFLEHPGVLISKDQLIPAVWGAMAISDDALSRTVAELRRALRDNARNPRFVETVHGRGFRFIAPVSGGAITRHASRRDAMIVVGREAEVSELRRLFHEAATGRRRVAFVTGEAGAGKSAVVSHFFEWLRGAEPRVRLAWGQAVEQFGVREPYMPALEAVERLVRGVDRDVLRSLLRRVAPTWLAHIASLHGAGGDAIAERTSAGALYGMPREFAMFVDGAAADQPLVLALEDLHWSDHGTVDLLVTLAQRPEPARLLVVATFRPAEAAVLRHPIAQAAAALEVRHLCAHVPLRGLGRDAIRDYLEKRLGSSQIEHRVAALVFERTEGNPLFMSALVNRLIATGRLRRDRQGWMLHGSHRAIDREIPDDLVRMLETQLRLTSARERALLGAASVAGPIFDVREVAAALGDSVDDVERRCDRLSTAHRLLRAAGSHLWPDGSLGSRFAFIHTAYQRVLYESLAAGRRAALHQRIGERLERGYATKTDVVAADLVAHFQGSHDRRRAVKYVTACARRAFARHGWRDAAAFIERALVLLGAEPAFRRQELELREMYGVVLSYTEGYTSDRLLENLARARDLCDPDADPGALFDVLYALGILHFNRGDCAAAARIADDLVRRAITTDVPAPLRAQYLQGAVALWSGRLCAAERPLASAQLAPAASADEVWFGVDVSIGAASHESVRLWLLGEPDRARTLQADAIARAARLDHPFTMAQTLTFGAIVLALCARWDEARQAAERALALSSELGFPRWWGTALVCLGRARVAEGAASAGERDIHAGIGILHRAGLRLGSSLLLALHADALLQLDRTDDALRVVEAGLSYCRDTTERVFEPELWRLKGELLRTAEGPATDYSAACFVKAVEIAEGEHAAALAERARQSASGVAIAGGTGNGLL